MAVVLLPQRTSSPFAARSSGESCRRAAVHLKNVVHPGFHSARQHGSPRPCWVLKAARNGQSGPSSSNDFNLAEYVEAKVETVKHTDKYGHIILLRLLDSQGLFLPVYIGDSESNALEKELQQRQSARPMTHDFMKVALETLGYRVTKVRVTALVGNTYHARVHLSGGKEAGAREIDIDARPSDAINLAVRFNAPMYVAKQVAGKMGSQVQKYETAPESHAEIKRSCREARLSYHDPTIMHRLNLQVAIAEERFDDACMIRDAIDKMLQKDCVLSSLVAMEAALNDERYEEALRMRDQFRRLTALLEARAAEGVAEV